MDRNLRAFLAVAEAGNLTAAAHRIGLTQPALTKTIRRLERDFETRLFDRSAKGMGLTAAGRLLFERARLIEMHYQQAHEEIHLQSAGALPEFRIAAGTAYHSAVAPDMVKRLSHEFPGTRFSLDFEVAQNALPRLMDGELDLLLGAFLKVPAEGIETETILKVDMTAYACRTSRLACARRIAPGDLAGRRWVVYQRDHLMAGRLQAWCADNMLPEPDIVMQIDSLMASFRVVAGTEFVTLASSFVRDLAEEAGLVMLELEEPIWRFESGAWYRRSLRGYPILMRSLAVVRALAGEYLLSHSPKL
jgi:DNA-binding transcriptional LysR family regulator